MVELQSQLKFNILGTCQKDDIMAESQNLLVIRESVQALKFGTRQVYNLFQNQGNGKFNFLNHGKRGLLGSLISFPYTNECQSAHEVYKGIKAQCSINQLTLSASVKI